MSGGKRLLNLPTSLSFRHCRRASKHPSVRLVIWKWQRKELICSPPHHSAHGPVPRYVECSGPWYSIPLIRRDPICLRNAIWLVSRRPRLLKQADDAVRCKRQVWHSSVSVSARWSPFAVNHSSISTSCPDSFALSLIVQTIPPLSHCTCRRSPTGGPPDSRFLRSRVRSPRFAALWPHLVPKRSVDHTNPVLLLLWFGNGVRLH
jgi:hypothetical protein